MTEPDRATPRPMVVQPARDPSRRSDGRPRAGRQPGRLSARTALLGAGTVVLAAHELPDPGHIGSSAVTASPGAGVVALAIPAVVLLLAARSIRHERTTGALVALAASSAVGYLAAGAVLDPDRSGTTDDVATPLLLALAVLLLVATVAVASWRALPAGSVTLERRTRVLVGVLLLTVVWGLLLSRHLTVWPAGEELPVRSADALADLVVLPAAAAAGAGLLARAAWAGKATFASAGCLALVGLAAVGEVWSRSSPGPAGTYVGATWTVTALGVAAAVPAVLCWTAVVRTGRQYWGGAPAAAPAPVPTPRPRLLPAPRRSRDDRVPGPITGSAAVAERTARGYGT